MGGTSANSAFWPSWYNSMAGVCPLNLDQSSPTCHLLVTRRERKSPLMVQCESPVTILRKMTKSFPWRQSLFFDGPSNELTNLKCFQQSHIYRYRFLGVFFFFFLLEKAQRTCLALFLAFCAVANFNPLMWLGLIVEAHWFLCWRECGSCLRENTDLLKHNIRAKKNRVFDPFRDKNFDFFPSLKNFAFPSLSHFLSGWVLEFGEPSFSSPTPLPVLNYLLVVLPHDAVFPCSAEKPCFHMHPSNNLKQRFCSFFPSGVSQFIIKLFDFKFFSCRFAEAESGMRSSLTFLPTPTRYLHC